MAPSKTSRTLARTALVAAAVALAACAAPAEQDDPIVVVPGDMAPDATPPDMAPPDAAPAPEPPARVLVERDPLPSRADNRVVNPSFDPRSPASWISDPMGSRIVDHRLPFRGPALLIDPGGQATAFYGRVRLAADPIELSVWIGVSAGDGGPEEAHRTGVLAELYAFTPDRDPSMPIVYQLLPAGDPVIGPRDLVWQRYTGGTRRPTLGWGWLLLRGVRGRQLAVGAPRALLEEVDPAALRVRAPAMPVSAADPAVVARLRALARPPTPRTPRPVSAGPRGLPPR